MPTFQYRALSKNGQKAEGRLDAPDRRALLGMLERQGLVPLSVSEAASSAVAAAAPGQKWWRLKPQERMSQREVLLFSTELSDLLAAGMNLGAALNCLASHGGQESAAGRIAADLRDRIVRGESFSDAIAAHPSSFPPLYANMIRAGEASGAQADVLRRLVEHYERAQAMKEKIVMALVYPAIVLFFGFLTVIFAMVKIVPQFQKVFDGIGVALPASTRLLIGTSTFLKHYGFLSALVLAVGVELFRRHIRTEKGRFWIDGLKLRTPLVKGIVACGVFANFAYTLRTLLSNGVNVLQALKISEQTAGNAVIGRELAHARERVTDGTSISGPLAAGKVFPVMMTDMLAIGEQTGDMPGALQHIGRRFENELDRNIKILTTALEPIMIVLVAIVVGFVAISILQAVFKVTSGLGMR